MFRKGEEDAEKNASSFWRTTDTCLARKWIFLVARVLALTDVQVLTLALLTSQRSERLTRKKYFIEKVLAMFPQDGTR